jgi:hypothetical protein
MYSSLSRVCEPCGRSEYLLFVLLGTMVALVAARLVLRRKHHRMPAWLARSRVVGVMRQIDSGALRVAWANYQIVQSVTWSIDISFPSPFDTMLGWLSIFSFDFLSFDCIVSKSNHFTSVYLWSSLPVCFALVLVLVHNVRSRIPGSNVTTSDLTYRLLLLCYLVLPTISLKQLQALDCLHVGGRQYLRVDTSIDCDSPEFRAFVVVDSMLIVVYLATPLVWLALLHRQRDSLNPAPATGTDKRLALFIRDQDKNLSPLRFLFGAYRPPFYFMEVVEM